MSIIRSVLWSAIACLVMAAVIPTVDWIACSRHSGGAACTPSRMAAAASRAWADASPVLLGIAYQRGGDSGRRG